MRKIFPFFIAVLLLAAFYSTYFNHGNRDVIRIISGSENEEIVPVLKQFESKTGIKVDMVYKGSVEIMNDLLEGNVDGDAVWPANGMWITMGDKNHVVKYQKSIFTSPVVFGIKKSKAEALDFVNREVSVKDILQAIKSKKLTFAMTSATQSNSGASAYIGFIYALLNNKEMISIEDLNNPQLKRDITMLLSGVNRSSGSSGWLKDLFLKSNFDSMVNYESVIIDANKELEKAGKEPLYIVYPYDGLVLADSPLGYINKDDAKKEEQFKKLQDYLLSADIQNEFKKYGRRTGIGGKLKNADLSIFKPAWGIRTDKVLSPIKMPSGEVIKEALMLYQTQFKKPSLTVFCLDFSGSMHGEPEEALKQAMTILLDQSQAKRYMLQGTSKDKIIVIPFDDHIKNIFAADGNDPVKMQELLTSINITYAEGGTDIYYPVMTGLDIISKDIQAGIKIGDYFPAIILMTDGKSNVDRYEEFSAKYMAMHLDVPVFSIMFGDASESQLKHLADVTNARIFDGKKDLAKAFKNARGYN